MPGSGTRRIPTGTSSDPHRSLMDAFRRLLRYATPHRAVITGAVLAVSQFTLYGDVRKGRRPSFVDSAPPEVAEPLYHKFMAELQRLGVPTEAGVFRADMAVSLINDGPVTILLDSARAF